MEFSFDNLIWMSEILFSTCMVAREQKRRSKFWLRAPLAVVVLLSLSCAIPQFTGENLAFLNELLRWVMWALMIGGLMLCFDENLSTLIVLGLFGNTLYGIVFDGADLIVNATGVYREWRPLFAAGIYLILYPLAYYFISGRWGGKQGKTTLKIFLGCISALLLTIFGVLSFLNTAEGNGTLILHLLLSFLALLLLMIYWGDYRLLDNYQSVVKMLEMEKKQYETFSNYIDDINIRFHDMKHQLHRLQDNVEGNEYLSELEDMVERYDAKISTGNKALDVILTEKSMFCSENNIRITFQADGEILHFMSPSDIYSLFGNLLDNSIEAVSSINDTNKKFISLLLLKESGVAHIRIDNKYEGKRRKVRQRYVTTKEDETNHGLGLKSIQFIVQKYSGIVSIDDENDTFTVNILIPLGD